MLDSDVDDIQTGDLPIALAGIEGALGEYGPLANMRAGRVNVMDDAWGAVGDGVTDDLPSLQAAVNSGAPIIDLPPGKTFYGDGTLIIDGTQMINGPGAKLLRMTVRMTGARAQLRGLEIDGDNHTAGGVDMRGDAQAAIDCHIHHTESNGVLFNAGLASRSRVQNCDIEDCGSISSNPSYQGNGVYGESPGALVAGNRIKRVRGYGGVYLVDPDVATILGNQIEDTVWRGIHFYSSDSSGKRILVANNQIKDAGGYNGGTDGVGCNGIYANGVVSQAGDLLIIGNLIDHVGENGIEARHGTIVGNLVRDTGAYPSLVTPSTEGIWTSGNSVVRANVVVRPKTYGLRRYTTGTMDAAEWSDNVIYDPGTYGIHAQVHGGSGVMKDFVIRNNSVFDTTGSPTATAGIALVASGGASITAASVFLIGNSVLGIPQSAITSCRHWGNTFDTPQAANADTSGATLEQLETEVNEVKAILRSLGKLAA